MAAVGFALIFGIGLDERRIWWIASIMLLAQFSISALNEWADADLDARAGRLRPIPLGLMRPGTAVILAVICAAATLLLSAFSGFGLGAFALVVIGIAAGWAYDVKLKRTPLSFLPFAVAFPLMPAWIAIIAGRSATSLGLLLVGAPLATAIHLADAIPDRASDEAAGVRTLAVALGSPGAEVAAVGLLLIGSITVIVASVLRGATWLRWALPFTALTYFIVALSARVSPPPRPSPGNGGGSTAKTWAPILGKWVLIGAAFLMAVPLVVLVSGR